MKSSLTSCRSTLGTHIHQRHHHLKLPPSFGLSDLLEPTSVLDLSRSPSPSTTTILSPSFTTSGSFFSDGSGNSDGPAAVAAVSNFLSDETQLPWAREPSPIAASGLPPDLHHISSSAAPSMEDLDTMLMAVSSPPHEPSFIRWIFGEKDDSAPSPPLLFPQATPPQEEAVVVDTVFHRPPPNSFLYFEGNFPYPCVFPAGIHDSAPPTTMTPTGSINCSPVSQLDAELYLKMQFPSGETPKQPLPPQFLRPKPGSDPLQIGAIEQLVEAAGLVEAGNLTLAQAILARLNHILSPVGKPLFRAAFYFKDALLFSLSGCDHLHLSSSLSPVDLVHKIGAYKSFSEVSPLPQFANFTANQALFEALEGFDAIHVVDFDLGLGDQWASFMQELALKPRASPPSLRLTAVVPADSMELHLTRENLAHFAQELNVPFRFDAITFHRFESHCLDALCLREGETVAVNFSPVVQRELSRPDCVAGFLRFLKRLAPRITVFVDAECEREEASFRRQFAAALQSYAGLMESLDAAGLDPGSVRHIERFLLQPRITGAVASLCRPSSLSPEKMLPWRGLLGKAFAPVPLSNFTETQADCLVRRTQVRGFHVEKNHSSLMLCWQRCELVSTSAWKPLLT